MTLDEFSQNCETAANAVHEMVEELDSDDGPDIKRAILIAHLQFVLPPDVLKALGFMRE